MDRRLLVLVVSKRTSFVDATIAALDDLASPNGQTFAPPPYGAAVRRARSYLDRALPEAEFDLVTAGSLRQAAERVAEATQRHRRQALALLLVEGEQTEVAGAALGRLLDDRLQGLLASLPGSVKAELSPSTTLVYEQRGDGGVQVSRPYTVRHLPDEPWLVAADVVCALTDYVQVRLSRLAGGGDERTLASALHDFLRRRAGSTWGLHYYTGSVVSGLIADLERLARQDGNPVLRGPSAHSLACGALARWQLDEAPFLIVVSSGTVDEFRGALSNLRDARAQGFIVCGESVADRWLPFQGTVHGIEDSREVLRSRRIQAVYLDRPERLEAGLRSAFARFAADEGPVVLLATPSVVDATGRPCALPDPVPTVVSRSLVMGEPQADEIMHIVNREQATLLWQCGKLTPQESELVHELSRLAGIGLVDSLARPGTVARYRHGRIVEEYLGTLGLYGYSARVYDYLHRDGRLKPRAEQCLFFLKSRIGEIATPFPESVLDRALRVVQVTHDPGHRAPFVDHAIIADLASFLRAVRDRLDVDPAVLRWRQEAIRSTRNNTCDVVSGLSVQPMSMNYFFRRLAAVLDRLITTTGYSYTGVFDVGRGGMSAVRNLPRTGPGFSGWYGRALMGDALQSIPALALTRPGNTLAFIGDGAAALVPDILPSLVQEVCLGDARLDGNLSIFRLIDGGHSLTRTIREARGTSPPDYQTAVLALVDEDWRRSYGPLEVVHRRLLDVDAVALGYELQDRGTVNLYSVILSQSNDGDGLSLPASLGSPGNQPLGPAYAPAGRPVATP